MPWRSRCATASFRCNGIRSIRVFLVACVAGARLRSRGAGAPEVFSHCPRSIKARGTARRLARPFLMCTPSREGVAPLGARSGVFCGAGPRFAHGPLRPAVGSKGRASMGRGLRASGRPVNAPPSASSSRGRRSAPGRSPGAARVRACEARPRAPAQSPRTAQPVRVPSGDRARGNINLDEGAGISFPTQSRKCEYSPIRLWRRSEFRTAESVAHS